MTRIENVLSEIARVRETRTLAASLGLALLLSVVPDALAQGNGAQRIAVPVSDPSRPAHLVVSIVHGGIDVQAYEGAEIIVEALPEGEPEEVEAVGDMFRIPNNSIELVVEERDNKVVVESGWGGQTVNLTVRVPRRTSVQASTVNGGNLSVHGVEGDHELSNVNGEIVADGIRGSVVANTTNGDVIVRFLAVDASKPMSFSTWNGDVDTTFPPGLDASLRLRAGQGEILTDFPVDVAPQTPTVVREEGERGARVKLEQDVRGTVGAGGPEFSYETYNGSIYIRSSAAANSAS